MLESGAWPAALLYAVTRSAWAWRATASFGCMAPFTNPGGNPVIDVPGLTPRSPVITEDPVLVTDAPPSTAKLSTVPSGTAVAMAEAGVGVNATAAPATSTTAAADEDKTRLPGMPRTFSNFIDEPTPCGVTKFEGGSPGAGESPIPSFQQRAAIPQLTGS